MNLRSGLIAAASGLALACAAFSANAQSCPGGGLGDGGVYQDEVPGESEPCTDFGYTVVTAQSVDATGAAYTAQLTFEGQDEYLQIGEVVEVELDYEIVVAALRNDPDAAMAVASAIGLRDNKFGVTHVASRASAKLTEAEFAAVANHVMVTLQNRAVGRSDPATNNNTSRLDRALQAFDRLVSTISNGIRNAIPDLRAKASERIRRPDGTVVERQIEVEIS